MKAYKGSFRFSTGPFYGSAGSIRLTKRERGGKRNMGKPAEGKLGSTRWEKMSK